MICGLHASRAHFKKLQIIAKIKSFSPDMKKKYRDQFSAVDHVVCHCKRHASGCGCLSSAFMVKARNNFSFILSDCNTAEEFVQRLADLARHARDEDMIIDENCRT